MTIDDVVDRLTRIVEESAHSRSRLGYFAALYRKVTIRVRAGIAAGQFEDGPRMARLDVIFATRYLDAYDQHARGDRPSECWQVSFDAAARWRPIILQHLLLGMNAHINLDLGIAAAEAAPGAALATLEHDFNAINAVLAELVEPVQREIADVSPAIGVLERIDPKVDDAVVNFSMRRARDAAWAFAVRLNSLPASAQAGEIAKRDREVAVLGRVVERPGVFLLPLGLAYIRARESNEVARVIEVLGRA